MKPPAFQFYADDFLGGTMTMSNEERGLYITLLCIQWSRGSVTQADFDRLSTAMAQPSVSYVKSKFTEDGKGGFLNARLEQERSKQSAYRVNRSLSGKAGADKRWHSHSTAIAQPMAKHSSPSPSPSPIIHTSPKARERDAIIDELALIECPDLNGVPQGAWSRYALAKKEIVATSPDVTPEEIKRRLKAYREKYPRITITAKGLASHWGEFPPSAKPKWQHGIAYVE